MDKKSLQKLIEDKNITYIDFRFTDPLGTWHHFSHHIGTFEMDVFEEGVGFDGSSIRCFQNIEASDMILIPDASTAFIDPFFADPTLVLICDILNPITGQKYDKDPRYVAKKAEEYVKSSGIGDSIFFGAEAEFFLFNDVRISTDPSNAFFSVDSGEAVWNAGEDEGPNLGYKIKNKGGYFPCPPHDTMQDVRSEMVNHMVSIGLKVEAQHHEVATAGQQEIDLKFDTLLSHADDLQKYKYVVRNTAKMNGLSATFMPKPLSNDNGSGMHCHQSIWSKGNPIFYKEGGYANLSDEAKFYIGGLLKHAPSLLAITNPTINSFKRLVPGYEAPVKLAYSNGNRSAICRSPAYSPSPKAKRIEFRCPDATANPYLAFAAMVMAGMDDIKNRIDPGEPMDKNLYDLPPEEQANIKEVPASLEEAINNLEKNHEYLLAGNVFTKDLIESFIEYKREKEIQPNKLVVTPKEFDMYYDY
jgi:glutamine synthetase